jgi:hypothetical protein
MVSALIASDYGASVVLTVLCSCFRNASRVSLKLKALDMFAVLGAYVNDELRLDRILPFLVYGTTDEIATVRAMSLRVAAYVVRLVHGRSSKICSFQKYRIYRCLTWKSLPTTFCRKFNDWFAIRQSWSVSL